MLENGVPEAGDGHLLFGPGVVAVGVKVSADEGLLAVQACLMAVIVAVRLQGGK